MQVLGMSRKMTLWNLAIAKGAALDSHADEHDARRHPNHRVRLGDGFSFEGALTDLDETIRLARQTVDMTQENHPNLAWQLHNLRIRLSARYSRTGEITDLEEALQFAKQVVDMTPKDHPSRARLLNVLANRLGDRYLRTGAMADLEESIQVGRQVIMRLQNSIRSEQCT